MNFMDCALPLEIFYCQRTQGQQFIFQCRRKTQQIHAYKNYINMIFGDRA